MSDEENKPGNHSPDGDAEPLKVILADDDPEDQELFSQALEKTGVDADLSIVDNGKELIDNLKDPDQENPDLIFLDINMPVMNGKEALKEIKKDEELKDIPTVVLSTSSHAKDIVETFDAGASLYVSKPYSFKGFVRLLKMVFSFHWAGALLKPLWHRFFISEKTISHDGD